MSIRVRLALWYGALLALVLIIFGFTINLGLQAHLMREVEQEVGRQNAHLAEYVAGLQIEAGKSIVTVAERALVALATPGLYSELVTANGRVLATSPNLTSTPVPLPERVLREALSAHHATYNIDISFEHAAKPTHALVRVDPLDPAAGAGNSMLLVTAASLDRVYATLEQMARFTLWAGLLAVVTILTIGWALAGSALRPIAAMTRTAREIALSRVFSRRIPGDDSQDELGRLARTFNDMLDSLEQLLRSQRRFVADASHELRAPLTTIQGNLELLSAPGAIRDEEREQVLEDVRSEVGRLIRMVYDLLDLARADAQPKLDYTTVELDRLVVEALRPYVIGNHSGRVKFERLEPVTLAADEARIVQLCIILIDNALQYSGPNGLVTVSVWAEGSDACLRVTDNGVGIAPEHIPHVFERFYRADPARSPAQGTGLGLSIAQTIVEAHHGSISIDSEQGKGTVVTVKLPSQLGGSAS